MIIKRFVAWLPYIVLIAILYPLGRSFFHIHHTILFLTLLLPAISIALVFSLYYLLREKKSA